MRLAFLAGVTVFSAQAQPFDIAPFSHRCSGADTFKLTTTFDYLFARNAPAAFEKVSIAPTYPIPKKVETKSWSGRRARRKSGSLGVWELKSWVSNS